MHFGERQARCGTEVGAIVSHRPRLEVDRPSSYVHTGTVAARTSPCSQASTMQAQPRTKQATREQCYAKHRTIYKTAQPAQRKVKRPDTQT
jgi:hypothetical protein